MTTIKTVREQARELAMRALADGQKPSALAIRDVIGTGSLGTIQDEIRKAKVEWGDGLRRAIHFPEMPEELAQMAGPFIEQLWSAACEFAGNAFDEERASWQQEIESSQADLDASRQQQDILMDELSRVQSDLQHTQDLVQEQARSLDLLRSELEHARTELMREKELAVQQRQDMELLHAEALQQASEEIRQQATRYALLNDELISERNEAARKLAALSATHSQAIKDLTSDRDLARTKSAAFQADLSQLRQQVLLQDEKLQVLQQKLAEALGNGDEASKQLKTSRAECDMLRQQVSSVTAAKEELAKLYAGLLERLPTPAVRGVY